MRLVITVSERSVRLALIGVAAVLASVLMAWWAGAAGAEDDPVGIVSVCAGPDGQLRIDEVCRSQEVALELVSEGALQASDARIDELEDRIEELEGLLAGVSRAEVDGRDTLRFDSMNLQVVNGTGSTDGDPNGLGNLIVGYNGQRAEPAQRSGSHYLVVGDRHEWTAFGGVVIGFNNTASGLYSSVSGGTENTAAGRFTSVSGGVRNAALESSDSVSGGSGNTADGAAATVSGGRGNTAGGVASSVGGGNDNTADGTGATVSGGSDNHARGIGGSVSGGRQNAVAGIGTSVSGGTDNSAEGIGGSISGGTENAVSTNNTSVSGGRENSAAAIGSSILGGRAHTLTDAHTCHPEC